MLSLPAPYYRTGTRISCAHDSPKRCLIDISSSVSYRSHKADDLPGWLGERRRANPKASKTRERQFAKIKLLKGQTTEDAANNVSGLSENTTALPLSINSSWSVDRETGMCHRFTCAQFKYVLINHKSLLYYEKYFTYSTNRH